MAMSRAPSSHELLGLRYDYQILHHDRVQACSTLAHKTQAALQTMVDVDGL